MKEGSFEGQIEDLDFSEEWTVKKTPLPSQIPSKVDISHLPTHVLRSNAIEALVSQNEDLMSRLGVALRRNAQLEERISELRLDNEQIRAKYDNLSDQLLVLKEKSRALAERKDREEGEYTALKEQIRLLEIRYAELYSTTQNKESHVLKELERHSKALQRFTRYRARIRAAAESIKKAARDKRQAEINLAHSEIAQENLRKHLAESAEYINSLNQEHKKELQALTEKHEAQSAHIRRDLKEAHEKNERLAEKLQNHEKLLEEKLRLENELILRDRREEELRILTAAEVSDLQQSLTRYRNDAKDLALRLETSEQELKSTNESLQENIEAKKKLEEQVENLQILWRDNQNQIEKLNEKNASLQKLNQELSIALNQYRREIRLLKEQADTKNLQSIENGGATPELMQKIDEAIVEIYSPSSSKG